MKLRLAAVACTALVLAVAAPAALAALPKPKTDLIVPNKSIGGVALNFKASQVKAAWGGTCEEFRCLYEAPKKGTDTPAVANVALEGNAQGKGTPKAWLISINVGRKTVGNESVPDFDTPLTALQTSKGIGLGSTVAEVSRAYPKAKKTAVTGGSPYFTISGPGESQTTFATQENRVASIGVALHPGG
jgi:hypothetical protein